MHPVFKISALTAALSLTVSCTQYDPYARTKAGAGIGAATGALLGTAIDKGEGTAIGAVVGALAGGAVGNYMDRQQQAFEQALAEEQRMHNLEIQRLQDNSLKLNIPSEVSFDFDSAALKPAFRPTLEDIANVLQQYDKTMVQIIGHTDSVGSDAYNMQLSQRRAENVAEFFAARGISRARLQSVGRGESEPRATNATPEGRQLNRRVEIIIKPVVQGQEQQAYPAPASPAPTSPAPAPAGGYTY